MHSDCSASHCTIGHYQFACTVYAAVVTHNTNTHIFCVLVGDEKGNENGGELHITTTDLLFYVGNRAYFFFSGKY